MQLSAASGTAKTFMEPSGAGTAEALHADHRKVIMRHRTDDAETATVFTDAVDGTISLKPYCIRVIDTPPFQRLRDLLALGVSRFVYSGAVHGRFQHSLGVAHKAYKVARHIYKQQGGERAAGAGGVGVDMEEDDVRIVTLAGLVHDLGHGPLSHPFDNFVKRRGIADWQHEDMSGRMLQYTAEKYNVDLDSDDVRRITELVHGLPPEQQRAEQRGGGGLWRPGRRFLFDIVANKRNNVDVDKVDYLARDALMCGVRVGCDFERLYKKGFIKVLDDEVCYPWSEYGNILDLFRAREAMHRKVYTNRKCKAVELMAVDALVAADPVLRLTERLASPEDFLTLDDTILTTIEHYHKNYRCVLEDDQAAALAEAQGIIGRLRRRELYRFGNQLTVPLDHLMDGRWESMRRHFTPEVVASCYSGSELPGGLRPADVICDENKIDHTMGGANPVERVGFFKEDASTERFNIGKHQVVGIMPLFFQERVLRVFTKHTDERYVRAIEQALKEWCRLHFGSGAQLATPVRPPRAGRQPGAGPGAAEGAALPLLSREARLLEVNGSIRFSGAAAAAAAAAGAAGAGHGLRVRSEGSAVVRAARGVENTPPRNVLLLGPRHEAFGGEGPGRGGGDCAAADGGAGVGAGPLAAEERVGGGSEQPPEGRGGEDLGRSKRQRTAAANAQ